MKKIFLYITILISVLTLSACNNKNNNTEEEYLTTITFWNIFTGPDGAEMKAMVDEFNVLHEGKYRVNTQTLPSNDFYEKLNTVVPQGKGPDVAIMHLDHIARYASLNMLTSFDSAIENSDFNGDDYIQTVWDAGEYEGARYGIPLDVHPIGLYYNKDLLDSAGLEVPTTYSELVNVAKALTNESEGQWGLPLSTMWPSQTLFTASLFQNEGRDLDENGEYPAYNTQEGYNAMKVLQDLIHVHKVSPENVSVDEDLALFRQGKAAFHINGIWMLNGIKESGINFGTAPIANLFGDTKATWAGSHNFVMPRPKKISQDKQEVIMEFVKYISENSLRWASAGQIPANNSVRELDEYKALPYHSTFADVDSIKFVTLSPYLDDSFGPVYSRVTEAMSDGSLDIWDLLESAETEGTQRVNEALQN